MRVVLRSFPVEAQSVVAHPRSLSEIERAFLGGEVNTLEGRDFQSMKHRDPLTNDLLEALTRKMFYSLPNRRQMPLGVLRCDLMAFKADKAGLCLHWLSVFPSHRLLTVAELFHFEILFADLLPSDVLGGLGHVNNNQIPSLAQSPEIHSAA